MSKTNANKPTKLGASKEETTSKRSNAILSSVFRSGISMRSFNNLPQFSKSTVPSDQLDLKPEEKQVQFSRDLKVADPQAPKSLVRLHFNDNTFEEVGSTDSIIVNIDKIGRIGISNPIKIEEPEPTENEEEEDVDGEKVKKEEGVLRNQFNFCDRATQGQIIDYLNQGTLTEAPTPKDSTGVTNQREIAAAYAKNKEIKLLPPPHSATSVTRIMERVVNQNLDPNACCDFKYFDDPRDSLTPDTGFTLPLWEFRADILNGCGVSLIRWNSHVPDLFAAAYAPPVTANDKAPAQRGYICTWTLKNQSTPRNIIEFSSPALSLDWCPSEPSLLATGAHDGNVAIFDVRSRSVNPLFSTVKHIDRHASGVTVVRWQPSDPSGNLTLISAGLDGRILLWTMVQNEMKVTEIAQLDAGIIGLDYFNEASTHFTVACDDGKVYRVLRTRTTQPPTSFLSHSPPNLSLSFNRFHPNVFATCGTDWSIKVWREDDAGPLQSYDFAPNYVTDIQFAPHSSTIIGAVTSDGELYIYDIAVNRYTEICKTEIVEQNEGALSSVRFHPKWPVILIGDEKGRIHAHKLSPNIRRNTRTLKEEQERNKLSKSSSSVRASRGLLPDLTQQPDDDDDGGGNLAAEEEAKNEALAKDESEKFVKSMGVSWIVREEKVSAIPAA